MNEKSKNKLIKLGIFLLLLAWLGIFMAEKIDLTTADLGRHLENGKWVVENHFNLTEKNSPIHENFYSYTNAGFPDINHHWGSGVIFYLIHKMAGFNGLSWFYVLFSLFIFSIFFRIAQKESNFTVATLLSLLLIPLMAERTEIRPEIFSYFFSAVFFLALWDYLRKEMFPGWLYFLPVFMIFWVNLHVYFFIGLFLLGIFWLSDISRLFFSKLTDEEFLNQASRTKNLTAVLVLSALTSLLSPFGLKGLFYPFQIFKNYGYTIVENKSVWFVENYGIFNSNFLLIKIVLVFMLLSFVILFLADRKKVSFCYFIFAFSFGLMGWLAIRNFTILGFFALPILALNLDGIFSLKESERSAAKENGLAIVYILISIFAAFSSYQFLSYHSQGRGMGISGGNERAGQFLKEEGIKGPIFNNYDIGGYLIFYLYPKEKAFVDNRPEAYPDSFFSEVYKPMQNDPSVFEKTDKEYNFNAVVFSRNDITPWGMNFLKIIKENPQWAKVFEDDYAVIYLKKNEMNKMIIDKYKI